MFKGDIYIQPRQTGKTTALLNEFGRCGVPSAYITKNELEKNRVTSLHIPYLGDCKISSIKGLNTRDVACRQLFVDEYLSFEQSDMVKLYDYISSHTNHGLEKVVIRTSSHRLYNKSLLELARLINNGTVSPKYVAHEYLKDVSDLMINLLCHPLFKVHSVHDKKVHHSPDEYKTQIVGEYYE